MVGGLGRKRFSYPRSEILKRRHSASPGRWGPRAATTGRREKRSAGVFVAWSVGAGGRQGQTPLGDRDLNSWPDRNLRGIVLSITWSIIRRRLARQDARASATTSRSGFASIGIAERNVYAGTFRLEQISRSYRGDQIRPECQLADAIAVGVGMRVGPEVFL